MFTALLLSAFVSSPRLDAEGVPLPPEAVARVGSARWRYHRILGQPVVSADGKFVYTAAQGDDILAWDAATGLVSHRFALPYIDSPDAVLRVGGQMLLANATGPFPKPRRVELADGGLRVVDCLYGYGTARTVDAGTGRVREKVSFRVPLGQRVELTRDGRWLVAHTIDVTRNVSLDTERHGLEVRDLKANSFAYTVPVEGRLHAFGLSPDDRLLAVADGATFRVLNAATGKALREVKLPADRHVTQLKFSPDGVSVLVCVNVAGVAEDRLELWKTSAGGTVELSRHPRIDVKDWMYPCLAFRPDGKQVAVGYYARPWQFIDTTTGRATMATPTIGATPYTAAYSPDGRRLYATAGNFLGHLAAIDVTANPPRLESPVDGEDVYPVFTPDGRLLAVSKSNLLRWDAATGRLSRTPLTPSVWAYAYTIAAPGGDRVATVSWEKGPPATYVVTVQEVATAKRTAFRLTDIDYFSHVSFSRDGTSLFVVTPRMEQIRCDLTTGQQSTRPIVVPGEPNTTGRAITAGDGVLTWAVSNPLFQNVWLTPSPVRYFGQAGDKKPSWEFTPGGNPTLWPLVAADGRTVVLTTVGPRGHALERWDGPAGRLAWRQPLENDFYIGCLSADARTCAGTYYGELILREMATGQVRHRFVGHRGNILASAFSPDGRTLAATSADAPIFLWDVRGELSKSPIDPRIAWAELASPDAAVAFAAVRQLAWFPEQSLPILREKLKPVAAVADETLTKLIATLDAPAFADREAAMKELKFLADIAVPRLEATLKQTESVEVRTRIEKLLDANANRPRDGEYLRIIRAVEAVEWMGTPDARKLLDAWAGGAAGARLTAEAQAARGRK